MIQAAFYKNHTGEWKGFQIKGHAEYASEGHDIVCSAVSALALNCVNSIEEFTSDSIKSEVTDGLIRMKFLSVPGSDSVLLIHSLILGLQSIMETYRKNYIQISFKEV